MRETLFAFVTFTRILLVVKALKLTARFTRLLPVTLPRVTHRVMREMLLSAFVTFTRILLLVKGTKETA